MKTKDSFINFKRGVWVILDENNLPPSHLIERLGGEMVGQIIEVNEVDKNCFIDFGFNKKITIDCVHLKTVS